MRRRGAVLAALLLTIAVLHGAAARTQERPPSGEPKPSGEPSAATSAATIAPAVTVTAPAPHDPFFLGWGSEPAMDYGGRTVASLHDTVSRLFAHSGTAHEHPGLAPVWEFPTGAALLLLQHEVV